MSESDLIKLQQKYENTLAALRPNALGIVDAFDYPDYVLGSALGAYDGNVYERLFEEAMKSPLNQVLWRCFVVRGDVYNNCLFFIFEGTSQQNIRDVSEAVDEIEDVMVLIDIS